MLNTAKTIGESADEMVRNIMGPDQSGDRNPHHYATNVLLARIAIGLDMIEEHLHDIKQNQKPAELRG